MELYRNTDNQEIDISMSILNSLEIKYKYSKTLISFLKKNIDNIGIVNVCTDNAKIYYINIVCGGGIKKTSQFYSLLEKIDASLLIKDIIKILNDNLILL